jgi:hypothetical protein
MAAEAVDDVRLEEVHVHFDSETWIARQLQAAAGIIQRSLDEPVVAAQIVERRLKAIEIRDGDHHMRSRHHIDGSARIVRRDRNVIGFRHGRDLLELADAARPCHVGHDVIGQGTVKLTKG